VTTGWLGHNGGDGRADYAVLERGGDGRADDAVLGRRGEDRVAWTLRR
jgi:hypothetical protein